jgi:hypothetical protein
MKKLMIAALLLIGFSHSAFAEDRTVQDTVDATRTDNGQTQTTQETRTTTTDDGSRVSRSGFYIEPLIFASQEDTKVETSQFPLVNSDTDGKARGYGIGLRLGGHVAESLLLGVDARYAKVRMDDSTFYSDTNANVYNIAPMVAVQTPWWGLRLMAGYVVAGENDPDAGVNGVNLKFKEAQGWRVGAGVHVGSVGVNLEYQDLKYNSTEIQSVGSVALNTNTSVDADTKGYALSLSFPIEM